MKDFLFFKADFHEPEISSHVIFCDIIMNTLSKIYQNQHFKGIKQKLWTLLKIRISCGSLGLCVEPKSERIFIASK